MGAETTTNTIATPISSRPLEPIPMTSKLASTPKEKPRFGVQVQLNSGEQAIFADPRATRAMVALMDMNALHGGAASHYGGPAAFAELMSATHGLMFHWARKNKLEWFDAFHFVNDAGHCENGLYALKANYGFADLNLSSLKQFRSIASPLSGHGEAHLFPKGVLVSNGPLGSGVPQAQGLAVGDALAGKKRIAICALSDGGAMEGEAKEALAAIPGLAKKGRLAPFVLIISDNRTKLSGRIEQDAFSMEPSFQSLEKLGWRVLRIEDGHHMQACVSTIEEAIRQVALDATVPVVVVARTIKGKGTKKTEASPSGAHGFPLKKADEMAAFLSEIYDGTAVPADFLAWTEELKAWETSRPAKAPAADLLPGAALIKASPSEKIQAGVATALIKCRQNGAPVVSVSADLQGSTGVADFHKAFPDSSIDVGVAEANMISTAVGLSLTGYVPVVDTFAQFGVTKGALPLTMASLSEGPVIGIFSHTGFQDAADGASHQALSFFAQVGSIPHIEIYSLSTSSEAEALITQAVENFVATRRAGKVPPTRLFFLGRENFPRRLTAESQPYQLGRDQVVMDNLSEGGGKLASKAVTIVASGSLVTEALKASDVLRTQGVGSVVIHGSAVNHPDIATVSAALERTGGRLVTVEEHRLIGGMGALLSHALSMAGESFKIISLGVGDGFGQSAYSALDLYEKHGLDSKAIAAAAGKLSAR